MHELPVTEQVLKIALRQADEAGAKRVTAIYLVLGQLSSMIDDSIQFYWEIIAQGTMAEGAELRFRRVPAELTCLDCSHQYMLDEGELTCPNCGSYRVRVINGEQFQLEAIDVEYEEAAQEAARGIPS